MPCRKLKVIWEIGGKVEQTSFTVSHGGYKFTFPLPRAEFETLTRDLLVRTRLTAQQVLKHANMTWDAVDRVLMVGGSTTPYNISSTS